MSVYMCECVYGRLSSLTSSLLLLTHIHIHTHIHQLSYELKKRIVFIGKGRSDTPSSRHTHTLTHTMGDVHHG